MKLRILSFAFFVAASFAPTAQAQLFPGGGSGGGPIGGGGTSSISGLVTDSNGDPVAFASVTAGDPSNPNIPFLAFALTDTNGMYTLANLPDGTFDVVAAQFGAGTAMGTVTLAVGQSATLDLQLVIPPSGTIAGVVTDAVSGAPVEGVIVSYASIGGSAAGPGGGFGGGPIPFAFTDANGTYSLDGVPEGSVDLTADKFGFITQTVSVNVVANQNTVQDFALDPLGLGSVSGTVTDAMGNPVEDAFVYLAVTFGTFGFGGGFYFTTTDASGNYSFSDVIAGDYDIQVTKFGFPPLGSPVTVAGGANSVVDFQFPSIATGDVEGTVTNSSNGQPVPGAFVLIPSIFGFATTDASGFYRVEDVFDGPQTIIVISFLGGFANGFGIAFETVDVVANQTVVQDIGL